MSQHPLETALTLIASARDAISKDLAAAKAENRALQEQANLAYIAAKQDARAEVDSLRKRLSGAYSTRTAALDQASLALAKLHKVIDAEAKEAELIRKTGVHPSKFWLKVAPKGGVSAYGFGSHPVTLYENQWVKLLANKDRILAFLRENAGKLSRRG